VRNHRARVVLVRATIEAKMATPCLTNAVAGGACEVDWTWFSASVWGRRPFLFVEEYLFGFIHWPLRHFETVTRP
jgi:hypothetical protein